MGQIAGAIKHPDKGKKLDISADTGKQVNVDDAYIMMYPTDGYGNIELIKTVIKREKPDAIMLITDPRYFTHGYLMLNKKFVKNSYYLFNIWDDYPAPMYNHAFYEACDLLMGISKQTVNINKLY